MWIRLLHALGNTPAFTPVETTDPQAVWLIERGHAEAIPAPVPPQAEPVEEPTDPAELSVAELRDWATALGLPVRGSKAELAARIAEHIEED